MTAPTRAPVRDEGLDAPHAAVPAVDASMTQAEPFGWTYDPWAERPVAASLAALSVLAMWLMLAMIELPGLYKLVIGGALALQLLPLLAPCECRVTAQGAESRQLGLVTRMAWVQAGKLEPLASGARLLRKRMPAWCAGLNALLLPMPRAGRPGLRERLEREWGAHVR